MRAIQLLPRPGARRADGSRPGLRLLPGPAVTSPLLRLTARDLCEIAESVASGRLKEPTELALAPDALADFDDEARILAAIREKKRGRTADPKSWQSSRGNGPSHGRSPRQWPSGCPRPSAESRSARVRRLPHSQRMKMSTKSPLVPRSSSHNGLWRRAPPGSSIGCTPQ